MLLAVCVVRFIGRKYVGAYLVHQIAQGCATVQTGQLVLYREVIAVCSEIHTKHIHTLCGQNVELLNVKPGGISPVANAATKYAA
jgi:hypothetical protein